MSNLPPRQGGYRPNPDAKVPERPTPPTPPAGAGGGSRSHAHALRSEGSPRPSPETLAEYARIADHLITHGLGEEPEYGDIIAALLDALSAADSSTPEADMDAVDHAAEHHAETGSDVCWCDFSRRKLSADRQELLAKERALEAGLLAERHWRLALSYQEYFEKVVIERDEARAALSTAKAEALRAAAKEAEERGDIGNMPGGYGASVWLNIRAQQAEDEATS